MRGGPRNGLRPRRVTVRRSVPPLHTKRRRASARSGTDQPIHPCAQRESNSYPEVPCERRPRPAECAPFRTERGWVRARSGTDQPIPPRAQRESNSFSEVPCGRRPEPAECTPPPYGAGLGQSPLWNRSTNPPSRAARKQFLPRGSLRATAQACGVSLCGTPWATLWGHSTRQMPEPLVIWPMIHAGCLAALIAFSTASARSASTTTVMPMPMLNT